MTKDRTRKIPEKTRSEQAALENDIPQKTSRRHQAAPERSAGFDRDHDPSHVIWFLD